MNLIAENKVRPDVFSEPIEYMPYLENEWVITTAKQIASRRSRADSRTHAQKLEDSMNGCAIQLAAFYRMKQHGLDVQHAPDDRKEYDIVLRRDQEVSLIDIKGIFKPTSKYFGQTAWEKENVPLLQTTVFYLCFDCRSLFGYYKGWCTDKDFVPSQYNDGTYVHMSKLKPNLF
jgi:hypothetical protein